MRLVAVSDNVTIMPNRNIAGLEIEGSAYTLNLDYNVSLSDFVYKKYLSGQYFVLKFFLGSDIFETFVRSKGS
jgi:hypothetical protein